MTSERFAGTLPVVPSASLAASEAARIYLLLRRSPSARSGDAPGAESAFRRDIAA